MTAATSLAIGVVLTTTVAAVGEGNLGQDHDELTAPGGRAGVVDASRTAAFGLRWRRRVVRTGVYRRVQESFGRPAISSRHGLVIVGSGEGVAKAFRLDDGKTAWRYEHGVPFESAAVIVRVPGPEAGRTDGDAEAVLLSSRDGILLALDVPTGSAVWAASLDGEVRAPAVVSGDQVFVATAANKVFALDLRTGATIWSQGRPPPTGLTIEGHATPFVDPSTGRIYACFSDGYAVAMSIEDGSKIWERPLSMAAEDFFDADADPVVVGDSLFVASYSEGIYALDPADGEAQWFRAAPAVTSLSATDDLVVAASADGYVWGLTQDSGVLAFRTRVPAGPVSRLHVRHGVVVLTTGEAGLVVLDASNGKPLQAMALGSRVSSDPGWAGKDLAVLSGYGHLYAMQLGADGLVRSHRGRADL